VGEGELEMLLAHLLLARLEVGEVEIGLLEVVERHVFHVVHVGRIGNRELEVGALRPVEVVERLGGLPQPAQRRIPHAAPVERIVDVPVGEGRIEGLHLDPVVIPADVPLEVGQRADRVAEEIGLERLADFPLTGRVGRLFDLLPLLRLERIGVAQYVVQTLSLLLHTHDIPRALCA
jgi:hypothetical protein